MLPALGRAFEAAAIRYSRVRYEGNRASVDQEREQEFFFQEREAVGKLPSLVLLFLKLRSLPSEEGVFLFLFFLYWLAIIEGDGISCNAFFAIISNRTA